MSNAHTSEERAAVRWWRKQAQQEDERIRRSEARLVVAREHGCVSSVLALPSAPGHRARWADRIVATLEEVVDAYRAAHPHGDDPDQAFADGAPTGAELAAERASLPAPRPVGIPYHRQEQRGARFVTVCPACGVAYDVTAEGKISREAQAHYATHETEPSALPREPGIHVSERGVEVVPESKPLNGAEVLVAVARRSRLTQERADALVQRLLDDPRTRAAMADLGLSGAAVVPE